MAATMIIARSIASASNIGHWSEDAQKLPVYQLTAPLPIQTHDAEGVAWPLRQDPIFLLGNNRLTLFVHGSGTFQIVTGERAWARLNAFGNAYGKNESVLHLKKDGNISSFDLVGLNSLAADPTICKREFGTGYATFHYQLPDGLMVTRTISVAPSQKIHQGHPGFVVSVMLENKGNSPIHIRLEESVLAHYEAMLDRNLAESARTVQYAHDVALDTESTLVKCSFNASSNDPTAIRNPQEVSRFDAYPPSLSMKALDVRSNQLAITPFTKPEVEGGAIIGEAWDLEMDAGATRTLQYVACIEPLGETSTLEEFITHISSTDPESLFRNEWKQVLPDFSLEKDPVWKREMTWHAHALLAMATYNEFYNETYIPQGQTYDYEMDLTAAPRDHLQHALAACYFNPQLAKSCIRFVLKKMTAQGEIPYTANGVGRTANSAWNTSDQQLFLYFAVGEYLRITKEYEFLQEIIEPASSGPRFEPQVIDKLLLAFRYLSDEVSLGSHGLVRLMNSDWSDMVYSDTSVFKYFWTSESHMNSAMVLAVFPTLIEQLSIARPILNDESDKIGAMGTALSQYLARMRSSFYQDLGETSFPKRLYFDYNTAWGEDNMHIEPQSYLLMAPDFPRNRKLKLWEEVQNRILEDEPFGPRQREIPIEDAMYDIGTGENGGVWYALAGPMIVGLGTVDTEAAWNLFKRMSLEHFAQAFPDYWVGQWTAPECLNSVVSGPISGLPRTGNNWTWVSFPAYCAHAHAWPFYCYHRLKEYEQQ